MNTFRTLANVLFILIFVNSSLYAELVDVSKGRVGAFVLTSYKLIIEFNVVNAEKHRVLMELTQTQETEMMEKLVLEYLLLNEAEHLNIGNLTKKESDDLLTEFKSKLEVHEYEKFKSKLKCDDKAVLQVLQRQVRINRLIKDTTSSFKPILNDISAEDVKNYFDKNKFKFSGKTFEEMKESIGAFLKKERMQKRLQEWVASLKSRYTIEINTGEINTGEINTGEINTGKINTDNINTGKSNTGY